MRVVIIITVIIMSSAVFSADLRERWKMAAASVADDSDFPPPLSARLSRSDVGSSLQQKGIKTWLKAHNKQSLPSTPIGKLFELLHQHRKVTRVTQTNIDLDALLLLRCACDLFIADLTLTSYDHTVERSDGGIWRKGGSRICMPLSTVDVFEATKENGVFDFLLDAFNCASSKRKAEATSKISKGGGKKKKKKK